MGDNLSPKRVSLSLATVAGIISIVCALLILIPPKATTNIFGEIFHGIDISQITKPITLVGALIGTIEVIVIALIVGWLFATVYNRLKN